MPILKGTQVDTIDKEFCVGNDYLFVEYQRSESTGDCMCGHAAIMLDCGLWVHGGNKDILCPPYNCECGCRHNANSPVSINPRRLQWLVAQHKHSNS